MINLYAQSVIAEKRGENSLSAILRSIVVDEVVTAKKREKAAKLRLVDSDR